MTSDKTSRGDTLPTGERAPLDDTVPAGGRAPSDGEPTIIKKYANRRLYNTGTSAYVTLEDLATMVKRGEDFVVFDARSGEDITRSVLAQIIFEQEGKGGQSLLPVSFLRQLIRFYGTGMQMLVPSYLEYSLDKLTADRSGFRDQWVAAFGNTPFASPQIVEAARPILDQIEERTRQNMAVFRQALAVFTPFPPAEPASNGRDAAPPPEARPPESGFEPPLEAPAARDEFDAMKRQLEGLQQRIEELASRR